jgi:hypothetical protein
MTGTVSSPALWAAVTSVTALGMAASSPTAIRFVADGLLVVWLVVSNVR